MWQTIDLLMTRYLIINFFENDLIVNLKTFFLKVQLLQFQNLNALPVQRRNSRIIEAKASQSEIFTDEIILVNSATFNFHENY